MIFSSLEYLLAFLPCVFVIYYLIINFLNKRAGIVWLCLSSLFFYGFWNPKYLVLILVSMVVNFILANRINAADRLKGKIFLIAGIAGNLGALAYFKYGNFVVDTISAVGSFDLTVDTIILPLAISFYTFQQVAFLVDAYITKEVENNFIDYTLFISFFPQLIAGPIVHHKEMMPQFSEKITSSIKENLNIGLAIICIGLFKKIILADNFALVSSPIFSEADEGTILTSGQSFLAMVFYSFQIYFDFSGYCDMAIGSARLFGIKLPQNFDSPYKAGSIIDFWRRWHMTLSRFLRDYLYFPLGGNRKGPVRRYFNLAITMLLGGLWHGAGWNFVIWGGLHGLYLCLNHFFIYLQGRNKALAYIVETRLFYIFSWFLTLTAVGVAWVFFKAVTFDGAWAILTNLMTNPVLEIKSAYGLLGTKELILLIGGTLVCIGLPNCTEIFSHYEVTLNSQPSKTKLYWRDNVFFQAVVALLASLALYQMIYMPNVISEFIYFQF